MVKLVRSFVFGAFLVDWRGMRFAHFGLTMVVALATAGAAQAAVKGYDFAWTSTAPTTQFSLEGMFTFDDLIAGAIVTEDELLSFMFEGFQGTTSLGTFSGTPDNFNFDAIAGQFLVGGIFPGSSSNQEWGSIPAGVFFITGSGQEILGLDGLSLGFNPVGQSTLTASEKVSAVPLPAALPLFLTVLAGMGFLRWWKRRVA